MFSAHSRFFKKRQVDCFEPVLLQQFQVVFGFTQSVNLEILF